MSQKYRSRNSTPSHGSASNRNRSKSSGRAKLTPPADIVKVVNGKLQGTTDLRTLRNCLYPNVDPTSDVGYGHLWGVLKGNPGNFILTNPANPSLLSGNEIIWVRTTLSLCGTHCRRGAGGRNRECDGDCGALHICRTFLLLSKQACPFNTKKKQCMFGHTFATGHNSPLLEEHNLSKLNEEELRWLFRRRPSRTVTTFPQVCIYYNKPDGKRCSVDKCKSVHLCTDFIEKRCQGSCSRNHSVSSKQVLNVLKLFAIDDSWTDEMILEDLHSNMRTRHRSSSGGNISSDEESDSSESFEQTQAPTEDPEFITIREDSPPEAGARVTYSQLKSDASNNQAAKCKGCEALEKVVAKMQVNMTWLMSQVKEQKKMIDDLRLAAAAEARGTPQIVYVKSPDHLTMTNGIRKQTSSAGSRHLDEDTLREFGLSSLEELRLSEISSGISEVRSDGGQRQRGSDEIPDGFCSSGFTLSGTPENPHPTFAHERYGNTQRVVQQSSKMRLDSPPILPTGARGSSFLPHERPPSLSTTLRYGYNSGSD